MPKNTHGGKNHKKGKNMKGSFNTNNDRIEFANSNQIYAVVRKKVGGSRLEVECSDGKMRSAVIPGKFFKKIWINVGDVLLCELNGIGEDSSCYISHKYNNKDISALKTQGKITFDTPLEKDAEGFKFVETTQSRVPPQRKVLDIANISDSSDEDDAEYINQMKKQENDLFGSDDKEINDL